MPAASTSLFIAFDLMDTYTHTRQTTKETFFTVAPFSSIFEKLKESFFYKLYKISFDASAF